MRQVKGFTLVELAIVLVVIGLMIGGILVAQSMIETSRINAQIKQLQQLDVLTQNFTTKFNRLPGDANSNGIIADYWGGICPAYHDMTGAECRSVFAELSSMTDLPGSFQNTGGTGPVFGPGRYGPYAAIGKSGVAAGQAANLSLFWVIGAKRTTQNHINGATIDAFTPKQALAIDQKLDDGEGYAGEIAVVGGICYFYATGPVMHLYSPYQGGGDPHVPDLSAYALWFDPGWAGECCVVEATGAYKTVVETPTCALQFKSKTYK